MSLINPAAEAARTVLGVQADADPAQVVRAYRHHARRLHPDVNAHPDAGAEFVTLQAAYRVALAQARRSALPDEPSPVGTASPVARLIPTGLLKTREPETSSSSPSGARPAWLIAGPVRVWPHHADGADSPVIGTAHRP